MWRLLSNFLLRLHVYLYNPVSYPLCSANLVSSRHILLYSHLSYCSLLSRILWLHARFQRLADKEGRIALADFQQQHELQGMLFAPRIFEVFDTDQDGYLNAEEFTTAVQQLGSLHSEEDKAACERMPYSVPQQCDTCRMRACKSAKAAVGTQVLPRMMNACDADAAVAFRLYDLDGDGYVTKADMLSVLRLATGRALSQAQLEQACVLAPQTLGFATRSLHIEQRPRWCSAQSGTCLHAPTQQNAAVCPAAQIVAATVAAHDRDGDGRLSQKEFARLLMASSETSMSISVS